MNSNENIAVFAGGCFWCIEPIFDQINGVNKVISGYTGGHVENPSYELVCSGNSGHTEAVKIWFNKNEISYNQLLLLFFSIHDPTTLNKQGPDIGTQYRSGIFYNSDEQKLEATNLIKILNEQDIWDNPIITEVTEYSNFFDLTYYTYTPYIGFRCARTLSASE